MEDIDYFDSDPEILIKGMLLKKNFIGMKQLR